MYKDLYTKYIKNSYMRNAKFETAVVRGEGNLPSKVGGKCLWRL